LKGGVRMSASIPVNSDILIWARNELNLSIEDVARKMQKTKEDIESWENSSSSPTYAQLEKLAYDVYKIPLAVFFFSEPPASSQIKSSFRTTPSAVYRMIPSNVLKVFREAECMIENLYELYDSLDISKKSSLDSIPFSDISSTARNLRDHLGISIIEQKSWGNSETALKIWREKITELGVFIFKSPFKEADYSGFCLYDKHFPVIYINSSNSKNRQVFTIFHELWHLLSRTSGIDFSQDDRVIDFYDYSARNLEIQCNQFAAEFLFPNSEFEKISHYQISEEFISNVATEFSVSREVVLRRFLDYKLVSLSEYNKLTAKWNESFITNKNTAGGAHIITMKCLTLVSHI